MIKENNKEDIIYDGSKHLVSIAPMLDFTTPHFRYLMRLITKETVLWTEMINYNTVLLSDKGIERELFFNDIEHHVVVQLGGSDPDKLAETALLCKMAGYDEINLNCGCPSNKVQDYNFGACLMKQPDLVYKCCKAMKDKSGLPITVKCRLGVDVYNNKFLHDFISIVSKDKIVEHFIIHSRIAIMGIDTFKNRSIPPLMYEETMKLKEIYPNLIFSLNGGIRTKEQAIEVLEKGKDKITGIMIGRAAYDNPFLFNDFDSTFYNKKDQNLNREEIILKYADYTDEVNNRFKLNKHQLLHPLTNIFNGERFSHAFKEMLVDHRVIKTLKADDMSDHIKTVLHKFTKVNPKAVKKINIYEK
jgi:tRNA-dihydrouridine synthase A